jgi:hypothetical protein
MSCEKPDHPNSLYFLQLVDDELPNLPKLDAKIEARKEMKAELLAHVGSPTRGPPCVHALQQLQFQLHTVATRRKNKMLESLATVLADEKGYNALITSNIGRPPTPDMV